MNETVPAVDVNNEMAPEALKYKLERQKRFEDGMRNVPAPKDKKASMYDVVEDYEEEPEISRPTTARDALKELGKVVRDKVSTSTLVMRTAQVAFKIDVYCLSVGPTAISFMLPPQYEVDFQAGTQFEIEAQRQNHQVLSVGCKVFMEGLGFNIFCFMRTDVED